MLKLEERHPEFVAWSRRRGLSAYTLRNYETAAKVFARYLAGQEMMDLAAVTPAMVAEFQAFLVRIESEHGKPYSGGTKHGLLSWLRRFFRYLHEEGRLLVDPTSRMRLPKRPARLPKSILTAEEMRRLLWEPDVTTEWGLRDRAILELLYGLGLRYAELADVKVEDVDLAEKTLWVRQGKGRKDRLLPLGRWAAYWLGRYLEASELKRREQGAERVFLTPRGKKLANAVLGKLVKRYARRVGIAKVVTPHGLRHTFATLMLRGGADVRRLQRLLGHSKLTSTEVYTHLDMEDLRQVQSRCHPRETGRVHRRRQPEHEPEAGAVREAS